MRAAAHDNRPMPSPQPPRRTGGALAVGAGIFLSRIAGLVRERVWAHYLGLTPAATLYSALLREITTKGPQARFRKAGRGQFALAAAV